MRLSPGLFLCTSLACLSLAGCSEERTATPSAVRPVRTIVVEPFKLAVVAEGAGRVRARYVSQVGFEASGRLISRNVDVGAVVRKGQLLARLDPIDYQNKVRAVEADLAAGIAAVTQTASQEQRYRILLKKGYATRADYENALRALQSAQAQVQAAEANLRIAQNQLRYTELVAPDDGVVTATKADPGQVVAAGQNVIEISGIAEREAVFDVAAEHAASAAPGMAVKVWLQSQPDLAVIGSIREISPEASNTTGTYEVKVALPSPPAEMRLGAIVVGRAEAQGQEVMSVPSLALLQSGEGPQVWVLGADGKVHRRGIELLNFNEESRRDQPRSLARREGRHCRCQFTGGRRRREARNGGQLMTRFNLSKWAVSNKSIVVFLMLLCAVAGLGAYERLGRQEDPDFSVQTMVVQIAWPGATEIDTLKQVTDRTREEARGDPEPRLPQELHQARTGDRFRLSQGIDTKERD